MMATMSMLFAAAVKLAMVVAGILYAGMVLMSYRTDGPHYRLRLAWNDPPRSIQRLLVWIGVRVVAATVRIKRWVLSLLWDTSADVGLWVIHRRKPAAQAVRSRFLV